MAFVLDRQSIEKCPDDHGRTGAPDEPITSPVAVDDALNVLADKCQFDANGATANEWVTRLDDNDYFKDLSFEEKREIARFIANNNCVTLRRCRDHLIDVLEEIVTES